MMNRKITAAAVTAIVLLIISLIYFLVVPELTGTAIAIMSYVFMLIAFLVTGFLAFRAGNKVLDARAMLFREPLVRMAGIYTAVMTVLVFVVSIIFRNISLKGALVTELIVSLVMWGALLYVGVVSDKGEEITRKNDVRTHEIRSISLNAGRVANLAKGTSAEKALARLAEDLRLAPPSDNSSAAPLEAELQAGIYRIEAFLDEEKENEALVLTKKLQNTLVRRNALLRDSRTTL